MSETAGRCRATAARWCIAAWSLSASVLSCMAGCAISLDNAPRNLPLAAAPGTATLAANSGALPESADRNAEITVALSFSGGGARAAAFSLGALQGLGSMPATDAPSLLDHLGFISSVSGGSLTAAWVGLYGTDTLPEFRRRALLSDH